MESWKLGLFPEDIDLAERVWDAFCLNNDLRAFLFAQIGRAHV